MSCDHCLNRRAFLARSAAAAAALVAVEGCGDGQIGPTAAHLGAGVTIRVADFPELATVGTLVSISVDRALIRTGNASFHAFSKICTHEGCLTEIRNNRFECPCHGSIFSNDGSVVRGPNGASGGISALQTLAVTFDQAAGTVTVS